MKTMKLIKGTLATMLCLTVLNCTPQQKNNDEGLTVHASSKMSSTELADAGEQLVTPYSFMQANAVFDMALEKDPSNLKAQFYKKFLARLMVLKGILTRVEPLVKDKKYLLSLNDSLPNSSLKNFLLSPASKLMTYKDGQDLLVKYVDTLIEFRKFLIKNNNAELNLYMNPYVFEQKIKEQMGKSCESTLISDGGIDVKCNFSNAATVKLNSADLLMLRQITAGEILMWSFYTSYSVENIEKVIAQVEGKELTEIEIKKIVLSTPKLFDLRKDQTLSMIPGFASDFIAAAKWAVKYQKELCPNGNEIEVQRKGFLFEKGMCTISMDSITPEQQQQIELAENATKGAIELALPLRSGEMKTTKLDYFAFIRKPISSLKVLASDDCQIGGKSLFGMFPNNDAELFVERKCE